MGEEDWIPRWQLDSLRLQRDKPTRSEKKRIQKRKQKMLLEFKDSDLKQSTVVTPGWYRVHIDDVEEKLSKDGNSTNAWIKGKILFAADTGDKTFADVPTPYLWMINSKGAFAAVPLFKALGVEVKAGTRSQTDALKGKDVDMFIGNAPDQNGVMRNTVGGQFRAPKV